MLVQRQTPSVQVFNRVGSGMLSFQYIFLSTNIICPIVVSYFPVSGLASMHACAVCFLAFGTRPGKCLMQTDLWKFI